MFGSRVITRHRTDIRWLRLGQGELSKTAKLAKTSANSLHYKSKESMTFMKYAEKN